MFNRMVLLIVLAILQACSADDSGKSNQVANPNMGAEISALSDGESVEISTVLIDNNDIYLHLNGNDQLLASNGLLIDEVLELDGGLFGGAAEVSDLVAVLQERYRVLWDLQYIEIRTDPSYFAIYTEPDLSKPFYVSFLRTADQSIKDVEVAMPPPFDLLGAPEGQRLSRSEPISIAWSPTASELGDMWLDAAATCVYGSDTLRYQLSKPIAGDPGVAELTADEIFGGSNPLGTCAVAVAIKRVRIRIPTTAFGLGCVTQGIERRVVNFTL